VDKKWLMYAGLVLLGYVFAPQIGKLPLLSKIPQV
jgi:hypothetical protein